MNIKEVKSHYVVNEFVQGQADCKAGRPHKHGTDSYNAGYSAQYGLEQAQSHMAGGK